MIEHTLVALEALRVLRIDCKECGAAMTLPIPAGGAVGTCPGCQRALVTRDEGRALTQLLQALLEITATTAGRRYRLWFEM